jgi:hypothetical protein
MVEEMGHGILVRREATYPQTTQGLTYGPGETLFRLIPKAKT